MSKPSAPKLPENGFWDWLNTVQCGDCLELLRQLPDESIDCCVTSPPYWNLRDFGVEGQLGTEETFHDYIENLCMIFNEVRRVLKPDGTCWVNMGDTYSGSNCGSHDHREQDGLGLQPQQRYKGQNAGATELPNKCLLQIPARFAIEMCNHGWILRNEIIWYKPNAMPVSVRDRFTVDFEKLFFFTKSSTYYFARQFEPLKSGADHDRPIGFVKGGGQSSKGAHGGVIRSNPLGRNKRCVWRIPTQPFPEAHFAVFPEALCEAPIKAGCPEFVCTRCGEGRKEIIEAEGGTIGKSWHDHTDDSSVGMHQSIGGLDSQKNQDLQPYSRRFVGYTDCGCNAGFEGGIVLDPFCGGGTTLVVASRLKRKYLGFEINPDYVEMTRKRL